MLFGRWNHAASTILQIPDPAIDGPVTSRCQQPTPTAPEGGGPCPVEEDPTPVARMTCEEIDAGTLPHELAMDGSAFQVPSFDNGVERRPKEVFWFEGGPKVAVR